MLRVSFLNRCMGMKKGATDGGVMNFIMGPKKA